MRYVTSIERIAKQEGIEEGKVENARESIIEVLEARFGKIPSDALESINCINDISVLKSLLRDATAISSIEAFVKLINEMNL